MIAIKQKEPFMQTKTQAAGTIESDLKGAVQQGMPSGFGDAKPTVTVRQSPTGGIPRLDHAITPPPISNRRLPGFPMAGRSEGLNEKYHQLSGSASRLEPLSEDFCNPDLMRFSWRRSLFFIVMASGVLWAAIIFGVAAVLS